MPSNSTSHQPKAEAMASTSIFFTLPLELRREIYRMLVAGFHEFSTRSPLDGFSALEILDCGEYYRQQQPKLLLNETWADSERNAEIEAKNYKQDEENEGEEEEEDSAFGPEPKPDYAILGVSRQIYQEASEVLYGDSWFIAHYRLSQLNSLSNPHLGDLGCRTANLHRVRRLVIKIRKDRYTEGLTARGIRQILQFYAISAKSLRYLGINFDFFSFVDLLDVPADMRELLQDPMMQDVLGSFNVSEEILIEADLDVPDLAAGFEKWPLFLAEQKDWVIYKHREGVKDDDIPMNERMVEWSIVPRGRMPYSKFNISAARKRLPVSGRIVHYTEGCIYIT